MVKTHHDTGILSVMIIKNAILIVAASRELFHVYVDHRTEKRVESADGAHQDVGAGAH